MRITPLAIDLFARDIPFARPFRFGAVTVNAAPQAYARVEIAVEGHGRAMGSAAELMPPRWFDKRTEKSAEATVEDLRCSARASAEAFLMRRRSDTAFGHSLALLEAGEALVGEAGLSRLSANFGPSLIDKAILDAMGRATGRSFVDLLKGNAVGLDARATPDLSDAALAARLGKLSPARRIAVRHTIGFLDALEGPDSLAADIAAQGPSFLKIKLSGDLDADVARLSAIAALVERIAPNAQATLDGNEQLTPDVLFALVERLLHDPALAGFARRLVHVEQPLDRRVTFAAPLRLPAGAPPVILDEADDRLSAFAESLALGYRGVSSKMCKGLYKALINAARVDEANARTGGGHLISGEDLTCQPGLAVQQDTAFAAALGIAHVERNGHHYVNGFGPAPANEVRGFLAAHPRLYEETGEGRARLAIRDGELAIESLYGPGFASGAEPAWGSLAPL